MRLKLHFTIDLRYALNRKRMTLIVKRRGTKLLAGVVLWLVVVAGWRADRSNVDVPPLARCEVLHCADPVALAQPRLDVLLKRSPFGTCRALQFHRRCRFANGGLDRAAAHSAAKSNRCHNCQVAAVACFQGTARVTAPCLRSW